MHIKLLLPLLAVLSLAACNYPGQAAPTPTAGIDGDQVATIVAATLAAELGTDAAAPSPTQTVASSGLLTHSLYFLSEASGSAQVWRLDADGQSQQQITFADAGVDAYDVSARGGQLAFVSDNQLWLSDANGGDARVVADGGQQADDDADYYYRDLVSNPRFSPDGRWLAYSYNGIRILDTLSGDSRHLISNDLGQADGGTVVVRELYFPEAWSPDGRNLLIAIGYLEGGSLAFLDPQTSELTRLQANGILCCQAAWAQDSQSVYVASPYIGLVEPGLWRYDTNDGSESVLFLEQADIFEFAGWPTQAQDGDLLYFYASTTELPEGSIQLSLVRAAADGVSERTPMRSETFNILDALWAQDAANVLIVQGTSGVYGTVLLVVVDGDAPQVLLNEARQLRWGP